MKKATATAAISVATYAANDELPEVVAGKMLGVTCWGCLYGEPGIYPDRLCPRDPKGTLTKGYCPCCAPCRQRCQDFHDKGIGWIP